MSRINELNESLLSIRNQKDYLKRHGGDVTELEGKEEELIRDIAEEESREAKEIIAEDYRTNDKPYIISVSGTEINLHDFIESPDNHRVIAIALSQRDHEVSAAHQANVKRLEDAIESNARQFREQLSNADAAADTKFNELYEQFQAMKLENVTLTAERDGLKAERHDLKNSNDDFERRLLAATSEIESLKQQLESATSKAEVNVPTNLNGNLAEAMRKANEAKRAIYDVQKDSANINYTAKFVDTDEEFTDKVIYIGKYRQLSDEEAKRFQQEIEQAKQAELESTPEAEIPIELVEEFRNELEPPVLQNVDSGHIVDEHSTTGQDGQDGTGGVVAETWEQWVERSILSLVSTVNGLTPTSHLSEEKPPFKRVA